MFGVEQCDASSFEIFVKQQALTVVFGRFEVVLKRTYKLYGSGPEKG